MTSSVVTLSKLDVATRQLQTAIRLYFEDGDPVSIHTLACAACEILSDLAEKNGSGPMLLRGRLHKRGGYLVSDAKAFEGIRPEYHKTLHHKIKEHQNFFKHADRDSDRTIDFNPLIVELHLHDACDQLNRIGRAMTFEQFAFTRWLVLSNPEIFEQTEVAILKFREFATGLTRSEYIDTFAPKFWGAYQASKTTDRLDS